MNSNLDHTLVVKSHKLLVDIMAKTMEIMGMNTLTQRIEQVKEL